ncbi:MAG: bifunctional phosphopantothenoylcysteine decarboxylase/phosphopantothenate--cysteine ligase CoaBC, partial [Hyphomicrobiales bacterium]|nr:bifunctional phosphopantothenoylcysteine decarboxylase/phosphopantothenate--cysteine ligase CoaBC [Hyphomicrobiales bacterium]
MNGTRILLIVGGGIAAYKCLELIRRLKERGASVRAVLTEAAQAFVTPLSVAALSESQVFTDLFDLKDETEMGHIQLSRDADLIVVAPATADLLAKMAQGHANDLASTVLLATDTPVLAAPAMNVRMWEHAATRRNVETLLGDGIAMVGPNEGDMACGEFGPGRMAEVPEILAAIEDRLGGADTRLLAGTRILVTSGPTHEPIDPVRYLANRSSGKQGDAIARAARRLGADVVLVSGPTSLPDPPGVTVRRVETAAEMLDAATAALPVDIAICAAAVADWRTDREADEKIKKSGAGEPPSLALVENPDILKSLSAAGPQRPALVVGFAAETESVVANAKQKRLAKGCDWIVANDVSAETGVMGGDRNAVHLITGADAESWPDMTKQDVANRLLQRI